MDRKPHEDKQEVDRKDGLREIPGDQPDPLEEVEGEVEPDDEQDEQPELGSGPASS